MIAGWPFGDLTPFRYGAILADPPWQFTMRSPKGYEKSPEAHYATMSEADLACLPVHQLAAPDCMLFMWATWPQMPKAIRLMEAWGFTYKTGAPWLKRTRTGKVCFGTGYILRGATEPFLIGTIGAPSYRSRSVLGLIDAERREHSRKPPEARAMVEKLLPDVWRCELFAREPWPGADVWGNEAGKFA